MSWKLYRQLSSTIGSYTGIWFRPLMLYWQLNSAIEFILTIGFCHPWRWLIFVMKVILRVSFYHRSYTDGWFLSWELYWGLAFITEVILIVGFCHRSYTDGWFLSWKLYWGLASIIEVILMVGFCCGYYTEVTSVIEVILMVGFCHGSYTGD